MGRTIPEGQTKQRKSSKKRRRPSGTAIPATVDNIPGTDFRTLIKVDPGRRDIVRAAVEDTSTNDNDKNVHIPNQVFQQWRKTKWIKDRTQKWIQQYGLEELNKLSSGKVVDMDQWSEFLDNVYAWMDRFIPFFQWRTLQRLRLRSYQQRYYALDKGCRYLLGWSKQNPRTKHSDDTIVAFGHNESTTGFGYASGPCASFKERLKRYVRVVRVNEYLTSQICHRCHSRLDTPQMWHGKKKKYVSSTEFKACPRCLNSIGKQLFMQ